MDNKKIIEKMKEKIVNKVSNKDSLMIKALKKRINDK